MPRQLELFGGDASQAGLAADRQRVLGARVPAHVRLGTSSWTFPGWAGIVYAGRPTERDLVEDGLAEYARHPLFRTVGIDRSYYRPLDDGTLRRYGTQLPSGYRCVSKVWNEITSAARPRSTEPNPSFLDAEVLCREVLDPIRRSFSEHIGPLVLEFPPSTLAFAGPGFTERLDRFLAAVPRDLPWAVELRNRELLTPEHLDVLSKHGVAHVFNFWEAMPTLGVQLDLPGSISGPFVVARLLIPPGRRYEQRKEELAPFDRIVDVQESMRADVVRLSDACAALGKVLYVIVNNKAEGSSPLTVEALAERLAPSAPPEV